MQIKKVVGLVALMLAAALFAGSPQFKAFVTQEDLEKGRALGISIDALGQMRLAPAVRERLRASVPYLWCAASDAQGRIYAGGGNPALVLRVTEKSQPDTVFTSAEVAVFAMVLAQNNLYIATAPDGQIYRLSVAPGPEKAQPFFKPEAKYIWAIASRQDGALYVATGEPGRVYLVQPNGKAEIFFQSEEKHLRSLALDKNSGTLYAGSSGNGYLYRLTASGAVSVLYDAPFPELHQLAIGRDGVVYAAAVGEAAGRPGLIPTPVAAGEGSEPDEEETGPSISITVAGEDQPQLPATIGAPGQTGRSASAVYRCAQDGMVKTLWNSRQDRIHAMLLEASGSLLIGTGDQGRFYRLADDGARTLLFQLEASQITSILAGANDSHLLTTANAGTLQQMLPASREKGEYLSDVIDAKVPSQWGAVNWQTPSGEGQARLFTRSGNTGKPDKTWSDWVAVQGPAAAGAIASPPARFLQWKLELTGTGKTSAVVKRVQVSYLQKNAAPEVTAINIYNPGEAFPEAKEQAANHLSDGQDGGSPGVKTIPPPESGRKTFQKGAQSIGWQARDDNNDRLIYRIEIRAVGETAWRELAKDYAGTVYTWDSQALPDGEYQIRITASDQRSNPPSLALASEKVSEIFIVDNTPPEVKNLAVQKIGAQWQAGFEAVDQLSRLKEAWYAVDADKWQLIYPVDNVADQRRETFHFVLAANAAMTATSILAVKVVDVNGNSGFGKVMIK
ncbi:MAG: hypothetical protein ONB46_10965 [candidate division KSB1 bacterium]|nr:hypothetical protein [candidate division KSB1 bacterium]MDZ7366391.1 hypothetical protein [candidate division KSB1 bacterium]MDZ7404046.1 hypothetical protein [candidate division KSB1 bacterium]